MRGGLTYAMAAPVGSLWLEGQAGLSQMAGPYARLEGVWHPIPPLAAFGFGQITRADKQAGVGIRLSF